MAIADDVRELVVEQLGVSEDEVTPEARFIEDLGADSLDTVELVMAFEEKFDVEIPDEDAEKITTVGEAIAYLDAKSAPEGNRQGSPRRPDLRGRRRHSRLRNRAPRARTPGIHRLHPGRYDVRLGSQRLEERRPLCARRLHIHPPRQARP